MAIENSEVITVAYKLPGLLNSPLRFSALLLFFFCFFSPVIMAPFKYHLILKAQIFQNYMACCLSRDRKQNPQTLKISTNFHTQYLREAFRFLSLGRKNG